MITNYISYFHSCYKADNNETGILNFFSSKYENQFIIKPKEELVNNLYPIQFIAKKQAEQCLQTLTLFKNDKELWYGSLFCLGKKNNFRKRVNSIAAPLFLYKAEIIEKEEDYFIKIDQQTRQLNIAFCRNLLYQTSFEDFLTEVEQFLEYNSHLTFEALSQFKRILEKHIKNLDIDNDFLLFPKLKNQTFLKKKLQNTEEAEKYTLVASSGVFISSRINNVNAVVNELELLKNSSDYSQAIQAFFSHVPQEQSNVDRNIQIPLLLNTAQERIVYNASKYHKSVIFGPPGTGKTYTINAIAQDYVSKGKSVLIVTKTPQALQVVSDKLMSSKIGEFAIKVGGNYYKRTVLAKLKRISSGRYYRHNHLEQATNANLKKNTLYNSLKSLETNFTEKATKEIDRVEKLFSDSFLQRTLSKIDINFIRSFEAEEWDIILKYFDTLSSFEKKADEALFKNLISKINIYSNSEIRKLITLTNILETEEKSLKNQHIQNLDATSLTHFLPIWLVKIDEVSSCLPMQKDLFDIAIVDEATQCDIASCLPIMQRAKKVVVAGDTNQLRHISFLSKTQMHRYQKQHNITDALRFNYRKKSLLDFTLESTEKGNQIVLLDEHYRSLPDIIRFSNATFYGEALRIMTQTPSNTHKQAVFLHKTSGKQEENGVNNEEINLIINHVKGIVVKEKETHKSKATSIGILSPFRQQTDYLTKAIKEAFTLRQIKKHKIKLGTPYHFQGEECDVMLLSMVVSEQSHFASLNYLNKEDVFNVAITRARHEQHVFYSVTSQALPEKSLLKHYLSSFEKQISEQTTTLKIEEDIFSKEIQAFLKPFNATIHVGYVIAGLSIDLLLEKDKKYLGIDLIGYPGSFIHAFDIERYRILHRVGIQIIPISYVSWKYRRDEVLRFLIKIIKDKLPQQKDLVSN
ncbi:AAA family ATPase [Tenacibaculum aiptasiae]|uniref:AAA family ATPase n=1 Tax=Tenacibaculum aiptasiae TaxID=426481 RepID=A0A7J5AS29_9FLAO|nr:AAA domain-containing protein [Tenacibaculum aiptasiae]KAB1160445.1 AAA family ATPase [Tenacibaculum aiptasiae]